MIHGGDRYRNKVNMDYSINVNPLGLPVGVKKALEEALTQVEYYPDLQAQVLTEAIAGHFGCDSAQVACGNGASELLMAVMRAFPLEQVLLPVPSFGGYPYAIDAAGIPRKLFHMKEEGGYLPDEGLLQALEELPEGRDGLPRAAVILTSPNNPTGAYVPRALRNRIVESCRRRGVLLILDECFMELSDAPEGNSLAHSGGEIPCLILRAFTKSFAIPGVRLGYMLGPAVHIGRVRRQLPEWNLSAFAQKAGVAAFAEQSYLQEARELIARERDYLTRGLEALGFRVWPSVTNFILFQWKEEEGSLSDRLLTMGTLIRDCSSYEGLPAGSYRIAVRLHEDNERLLAQLAEAIRE